MDVIRRPVPLIICGGAGTRLWPASRKSAPKQFISLMGTWSSFQETVLRVSDAELFAEPVIITNEQYRPLVSDQLEALGIRASILLEPSRRESGPAIAAAASFIQSRSPDDLVMVLAADHVVRNVDAFKAAARKAVDMALAGMIVTFGVPPDKPATDYGYIRRGAEVADGVFKVDAFVEKPDQATAERYIREGYLWNSGNFMFRTDVLLSEYGRFDPSTVEAVAEAMGQARRDRGWVVLDHAQFDAAAAFSIDVAVMEKTDRIAVIPVEMDWSDIGSWHAVWELTEKDEDGNAAIGDVVFVDATNNFVSGRTLVCLAGVANLAVIATDDAVLVIERSRIDCMRALLERLKKQGRRQLDGHPEEFCPGGRLSS